MTSDKINFVSEKPGGNEKERNEFYAAGYNQCIEDGARDQELTGSRMLIPVIVYYSIEDTGDGCAILRWYQTETEAKQREEDDSVAFQNSVGSVQTYEGSAIHTEALLHVAMKGIAE